MKQNKSTENLKKEFKQSQILIGVVITVVLFYISSTVAAIQANMGLTFSDAISAFPNIVAKTPFYFLPINYNITAPLVISALGLMYILLDYLKNVDRLTQNQNTSKGSSEWGEAKEYTNRYADNPKNPSKARTNVLFSQNFYASTNVKKHFKALNTLILGASGSGKSRYFLKPNLLQMNTSYVITDPKGEILTSCGEALRRNGYDIKVFDIVEMGMCNTYNPMKYCRRESDIKKVVEAFIKNTDKSGGNGGGKDPFWDDAMNGFMCACIGFLTMKPEGYDVPYSQIKEITGGETFDSCFSTLCEFTRMANTKWTPGCGIEAFGGELGDGKNNTANASKLARIFENLRAWEAERQGIEPDLIQKPYCLREWENFKIAPEKTSTTILMTVAVRLDPFNIEQVRNLTSTDTLDLYDFAKKKTALFMIMPATDRTYNFLLAFLYTQLFDILYQFGEKQTEGSKILKTDIDEFVKYYSKDEVNSGYAEENFKKIISTAHAEERIISEGQTGEEEIKVKMFKYFGPEKKIKVPVKIEDKWYDIVTDDGELITRKPDKETADIFLSQLKNGSLKWGKVPALPLHFRFLIDEFPNIGEIPEFKEKLATMRGYEISATVICQSITQLKGMYEKDYEVVDANCPFLVFLGGDENSNNEYLAKKMGDSTIKVRNNSVDTKAMGSSSYNTDARQLMKPEEFGRMDYSKEIVFVYGEQPLMDDKYDYPSHPNYKWTHEYANDVGVNAYLFDRSVYLPSRGEKLKMERGKFEGKILKKSVVHSIDNNCFQALIKKNAVVDVVGMMNQISLMNV